MTFDPGQTREIMQILERIAGALEVIAVKDSIDQMDSNTSTLYLLAGNTAGFADELDSVLKQPDAFKRAIALRDLQKKARRIANTYQDQADAASKKADSGLDSTDEDNPPS